MVFYRSDAEILHVTDFIFNIDENSVEADLKCFSKIYWIIRKKDFSTYEINKLSVIDVNYVINGTILKIYKSGRLIGYFALSLLIKWYAQNKDVLDDYEKYIFCDSAITLLVRNHSENRKVHEVLSKYCLNNSLEVMEYEMSLDRTVPDIFSNNRDYKLNILVDTTSSLVAFIKYKDTVIKLKKKLQSVDLRSFYTSDRCELVFFRDSSSIANREEVVLLGGIPINLAEGVDYEKSSVNNYNRVILLGNYYSLDVEARKYEE